VTYRGRWTAAQAAKRAGGTATGKDETRKGRVGGGRRHRTKAAAVSQRRGATVTMLNSGVAPCAGRASKRGMAVRVLQRPRWLLSGRDELDVGVLISMPKAHLVCSSLMNPCLPSAMLFGQAGVVVVDNRVCAAQYSGKCEDMVGRMTGVNDNVSASAGSVNIALISVSIAYLENNGRRRKLEK